MCAMPQAVCSGAIAKLARPRSHNAAPRCCTSCYLVCCGCPAAARRNRPVAAGRLTRCRGRCCPAAAWGATMPSLLRLLLLLVLLLLPPWGGISGISEGG
jgi:hypothetical protein